MKGREKEKICTANIRPLTFYGSFEIYCQRRKSLTSAAESDHGKYDLDEPKYSFGTERFEASGCVLGRDSSFSRSFF